MNLTLTIPESARPPINLVIGGAAELTSEAIETALGYVPADPASVPTEPGDIGAEPALGNPDTTGKVLSSTDDGTRSWITPSGTVDNAAVNAAIVEDPAATRAAMQVYAGKIKHFSDYQPDASGASSVSQLIQNAINALSPGDTLQFPSGATFLCRRIFLKPKVKILAHDCTFILGGDIPIGSEMLQDSIFNGLGAYENRKSGFTIDGGIFIGTLNPATSPPNLLGDDIIQFEFCDDIQISNVIIKNAGQDCIEFKSCDRVLVENCQFERSGDAAIEFRNVKFGHVHHCRSIATANFLMVKNHIGVDDTNYGYSENIRVNNNDSKSWGQCYLLNWPNNCVIDQNTMAGVEGGENTLRLVIEAHPVALPPGHQVNIFIQNNYVVQGGNTAFRASHPPGTVTSNVSFSGNHIVGGTRGIDISSNGVVENNLIQNTSGHSIYCAAPGVLAITNNICDRSISVNGTGVSNINGNRCSNLELNAIANASRNILNGISALANAANSKISQNQITVNSGTVGFGSSANNLLIEGNVFVCNTTNAAFEFGGQSLSFVSNQITQSGAGAGVSLISGAAKCAIIGNNVVKSGGGSVGIFLQGDKCSVSGNRVSGFNQNIRIGGSGDNNTVIGNICDSSSFQGIQADAGATNNIIVSNVVTNSASTPIVNNATGTIIASNHPNTAPDAPGPYDDDAAAAAATPSVPIGKNYRVTGGGVAWRQS
jgi:hypothetical protein